MAEKANIDEFLAGRKMAIAGVSRNPKKFGYMACKEIIQKGFAVYPINPAGGEILGLSAYPKLESLPEKQENLLVLLPKIQAYNVIKDAFRNGIKRIWLQQGSESAEALEFCSKNGVTVITGRCILMFIGSHKIPHRIHRWFSGVFGMLPK
ncbi:MAG: CoA-binding protein [Ignavibacteria bacterium]|nr:CoA-binding protein [Ignavibacteria bacterium]